MKKPDHIYKILIIFFLLFTLSACEKKSDRNSECNALSGAIKEANSIADARLPGAHLDEILGYDVQPDGTIGEDYDWTFYYFRQNQDEYDFYAVVVYPGCEVFHWDPSGAITYRGIPDYTSAAGWVAAADESMEVVGKDYNHRAVQVFADADDLYPTTAYLVYVFYYLDLNDEPISYVVMDADTDNVLMVEANP